MTNRYSSDDGARLLRINEAFAMTSRFPAAKLAREVRSEQARSPRPAGTIERVLSMLRCDEFDRAILPEERAIESTVNGTTETTQVLYDALSRVEQVTYSAGPETYEAFVYDRVGNRRRHITSTEERHYEVDEADQLQGIWRVEGSSRVQTDAFNYDGAGRRETRTRTSGADESYSYDALGRLRSFTPSQGDAFQLAYDALGTRYQRTGAQFATYFGEWVERRKGESRRLIHGPGIDNILAEVSEGQVYSLLQDGTANVVGVTEGGAWRNRRSYEAFGTPRRGSAASRVLFESDFSDFSADWGPAAPPAEVEQGEGVVTLSVAAGESYGRVDQTGVIPLEGREVADLDFRVSLAAAEGTWNDIRIAYFEDGVFQSAEPLFATGGDDPLQQSRSGTTLNPPPGTDAISLVLFVRGAGGSVTLDHITVETRVLFASNFSDFSADWAPAVPPAEVEQGDGVVTLSVAPGESYGRVNQAGVIPLDGREVADLDFHVSLTAAQGTNNDIRIAYYESGVFQFAEQLFSIGAGDPLQQSVSGRTLSPPPGTDGICLVLFVRGTDGSATFDHIAVEVNGAGAVERGFAGRPPEGESGLIYMRARHYDPSTGRFLQTDPMGIDSTQLYAYAENNPFVYRDPTGLSSAVYLAGVPFSLADTGPTELTTLSQAWTGLSSEGIGFSGLLSNDAYVRSRRADQAWDEGRFAAWAVNRAASFVEGAVADTAEYATEHPVRFARDALTLGLVGRVAGFGLRGATGAARLSRSTPFVYGDLPAGVLGSTNAFGKITIQRGLSGRVFRETVRHESVHSFLSPKYGPFRAARAKLGMAAYNRSHLVRYIEEAAAEAYGTGSIRQGLRYPLQFASPQITRSGLLTEGLAYSGLFGGAVYAGYELGGP